MAEPLIVIPARYASSRFPGKPLAEVAGKSLLSRVWARCVQALPPERVVVATDDERIATHCTAQGMAYVMTPSDCPTGTDRVHHVARQMDASVYINVQGDEPLIEPGDIRTVIEAAQRYPGEVVNAYCAIEAEADFRNPNVPKVVVAPDGRLLYMSRAAVPTDKQLGFRAAWKQVCIYALPAAPLAAFFEAGSKTTVEAIEDIEILRFLELGHTVRMVAVSSASIAVDVPEDVVRVEEALGADAAS